MPKKNLPLLKTLWLFTKVLAGYFSLDQNEVVVVAASDSSSGFSGKVPGRASFLTSLSAT